MLVPEEYRCCICLSVPERALLSGCPHRVCTSCADSGNLEACPVCRATLPPERPHDKAFARTLAKVVLKCECGKRVPLLEAESHHCEHTRKRKRPEEMSPVLQGRKAPPAAPNRSTFACPFCEEKNLTTQALLEHCEHSHAPQSARGTLSAVCPICMAMPWGDPSYVSRDLVSHLKTRHRCDYTTLTDFDADEEAMFERAMAASMRSAGFEEQVDENERMLAEVLRLSAQEAGLPPDEEAGGADPTASGSGGGAGGMDETGDGGDGSSDSGSSSTSRGDGATASSPALAGIEAMEGSEVELTSR
mmetsp:Transcript_66891/g.217560  ORF Transcript_66891/g.217560 Transcript_66891/m.217560 type:complete len:304 (-) Transcript_66891:249-1160(-)|eukprot:CAMPEP_0203928854 /NCGR_PEP_ID=MMETSP0359-20131031/67943_1 /ASSEMBLY_ACC=CAM_ASM_000338 /TAXON_ID=268821 /ORGANISM="Scrippsiella Hangoei, Strain SHTV-5" /LENGTH=303 /DNA_ID=CAMNT_0050857813 /DNA_START=106 /DNA_END=1017 /DNA_ORIENTATION=+